MRIGISVYTEYSYKEKLTIGEKRLYQLGECHNIVVLPIAKERANLLIDNINLSQIDNYGLTSLSVSYNATLKAMNIIKFQIHVLFQLYVKEWPKCIVSQ